MHTPSKTLRRAALALAALLLAATALAQRPLVSPNYYTFQLPELAPGEPVTGYLDESDGQNFKDGSRLDLYQFTAEAGEAQSVRVVSPVFSPVVSVFDELGNLVAYVDYGMEFGDVAASFITDTAGRYLVVVSGWSDYDLGEYTITRAALTGGPADARPVTVPSTVESAITAEMPPLVTGYGGSAEYFAFEVNETTLLVATMSSAVLDAYLLLLDADGNVVAENDDDGYTTDAMLVAMLEPGSYVLAASTYYLGEVGDYTLTLEAFYRR